MKLELGAGGSPTEGFEHADVRKLPHIEHVFDMLKPFPFPDNHVEHLLMHQTLEHFSHYKETDYILKECFRIIKPGGILQLSVPNLEGWMEEWAKGKVSWPDLVQRIYGGQDYEFNFHKAGFSDVSLLHQLNSIGFLKVDFRGTCWTDIHAKATKIV